MKSCMNCDSALAITRAECPACGVGFEGAFHLPRIARLSREHTRLAEAFLLTGGNLKEMGQSVGMSYPTLRKRIDELVGALRELEREDERRIESLLDAVEKGEMTAEEAARIGRELSGDL